MTGRAGDGEESEKRWWEKLTPAQYAVLREGATEPPFSGRYVHHGAEGMYRCAACGSALFSSTAKFDSESGWPSFTGPAGGGAVTRHVDRSGGLARTEVRCAACGSHLGHVFGDGPRPSGKRYCINSLALTFDARRDG